MELEEGQWDVALKERREGHKERALMRVEEGRKSTDEERGGRGRRKWGDRKIWLSGGRGCKHNEKG